MLGLVDAAKDVLTANNELATHAISLKKEASKDGWFLTKATLTYAGLLVKPAINALSNMNLLCAMAESASDQSAKDDSSSESEVQEADGEVKNEEERAPVTPEDSPEGDEVEAKEQDDQPLQEAEDETGAGGDEAEITDVETSDAVASVTEVEIEKEQEALESAFNQLLVNL